MHMHKVSMFAMLNIYFLLSLPTIFTVLLLYLSQSHRIRALLGNSLKSSPYKITLQSSQAPPL